ncbi:MAG TPA: hypothetical protein VGM37_03470 [Armatimonadota bacterium]|jgi:hypothetical protein
MKCALLCLAVAAMAVFPARADEAYRLRYIDAAGLQNRLKSHHELDGVVVSPTSNPEVILRGTEDQVARAKTAIAALDVPCAQYAIKVEVIHCVVDADGKAAERTILAPLLSLLDGVPAKMATGDLQMDVTPISNEDGTVTLDAEFRQQDSPDDIGRWAATSRRMALGKKERLLGLTDSPEKALRKAVRNGEIVRDRGAYVADYFDVTITKVDS